LKGFRRRADCRPSPSSVRCVRKVAGLCGRSTDKTTRGVSEIWGDR
jgi:hypothetical protein